MVDLHNLLGLALTLTLSFSAGPGEVVIVVLFDKGLGAGPLLALLDALVRLADSQGVLGFESELLLGLLSEVVGKGDMLVLFGGLARLFISLRLGLSRSLSFNSSLLLLSLGNLLAGLLVLQLGLAFWTSPGLVGLLFRST